MELPYYRGTCEILKGFSRMPLFDISEENERKKRKKLIWTSGEDTFTWRRSSSDIFRGAKLNEKLRLR